MTTKSQLPPTVTRILEFDAAHRVLGHESKCANLHGHRYKVEITARAEALDGIGRVIDFSVLKAKVGGWIDDKWDHNVILCDDDQRTIECAIMMPRVKDPYCMATNPTAENMASYLLEVVCPFVLVGTGVIVTKVVVWETPNCSAEATLGELVHQ